MTAPTGWWCPHCGHTVDAVVGTQPHPEPRRCETETDVRALVFTALDNAVGNDYADFLDEASDREITDDLTEHDSELAEFDVTEIQPYVGEWQAKRSPCPTCRGRRRVWDPDDGAGMGAGMYRPCPDCAPVGVPVGDDTSAPTADRWSVVDGELRYRYAPGAWVGIPRDRLRSGPDGDRAYNDLVALVRRAGAAPDLTALEPPSAEVRALRALAAVVADDFETSGATYTGPEVAMTLRSVFRAATADPTPQTETTGGD